jgi:peptidoglycan/LPS O-acetylase OafA/YrhL
LNGACEPELLGWRPGLDGLRGVAILMVMLFHFPATRDWFPGGSLGVDIFFVLSGFLITTLLLEERSRTGGIALLAFFQRRARRLFPALAAFLAIFSAITLLTAQPGVDRLPGTLIFSSLYVHNWILALGGHPTVGTVHIWSLSVEEQFYILWPLTVIVAMKVEAKALLVLSILLLAVSASMPVWSGRSGAGLYYGTDFRGQALIVGAILAQLRISGVVNSSIAGRAWFRTALLVCPPILGAMVFGLVSRPDFIYTGLYTVAAVISAVIICVALYAPPRILTNSVIRYVGTRSYALYLWHMPIAFWLRDLDATLQLALSIGLSFAAAEISWHLVERRGSYLGSLPGRIRRWLTASESSRARPSVAVRPRPLSSE